MTVAIVVKVSEGLVLAADSAGAVEGTLQAPGQPPQRGLLKVYSNAAKVAQIRDWPVGTVTFGMAQIGRRTIDSHIREFAEATSDQPATVSELAKRLCDFLAPRHAAEENRSLLGIHLAGYPPQGFFPEQYLIQLSPTEPGASIEQVRPDQNGAPDFGANWYGQTDAIQRVHAGFAPELPPVLQATGVQPHQLAALQQLGYPIIFEAMPLQDAIDYATWLANIAIGRFRFVVGAATVVGPVDVAIITRHEGFQWVVRKRPEMYSPHPFTF